MIAGGFYGDGRVQWSRLTGVVPLRVWAVFNRECIGPPFRVFDAKMRSGQLSSCQHYERGVHVRIVIDGRFRDERFQ